MFTTLKSAMILLLFGTVVLLAAGPPPALKDPFLDNFVGDWSVARKMGNGRTIESIVRGEWVLKHQFIQLHYGAGEKAPEYEALVFIGFRFDSKEGSLTNKFLFDPETKGWTSLIRQEESGQWKTFAEEKWTRK